MDIGIDDTDSIAHAAVVCQEENGKIRGISHGGRLKIQLHPPEKKKKR